MARHINVEGINPTPKGLVIYLAINVGMTKRFVSARIPWNLMAHEWENVTQGVEAVFMERLKAEANAAQLPLPLEAWE